MGRNTKTGIAVAFVVAILAAVLFITKPWSTPRTTATFQVVANLPVTGELAVWGGSIKEGALFAMDELAPANLRVDWEDNASNAATAVSIFRQQTLRRPDVYVSGIKPQTMAILDQVTALGVPHIVWIFDPQINPPSGGRNFRTMISYKLEAPQYLAYLRRRSARRVAIVYVELPHTLAEFQGLVVPPLTREGVEVREERYEFAREDFRDVAVRVRDFHPDAIILNGFQPHLVRLVRALRSLDLITDGNTIGTYDMIDAATILGADEIEGIRAVAPRFETRPTEGAAGAWRTRFERRFGRRPLYIHAFGYDMVAILSDVASRLPAGASSEQWLAALRATNIQGVTGPLRFDGQGDLVTPVEVGVYRQGRLVPE